MSVENAARQTVFIRAQGAIRRGAAILLSGRLAAANFVSRRRVVGGGQATVSLTTYGSRWRTVHQTIESIGRGSVLPRAIVLWVDDPAFVQSPTPQLRRLIRRGLRIELSPDLGPHKKYFPALEEVAAHNDVLVTADDDVMYRKHWLRDLLQIADANPDTVIAYRARRVTMKGADFAPWSDWPLVTSTTPSTLNIAIGEAGVLYPLGLTTRLMSRGDGFLVCAPRADDLWLHATGVLAEIPTRQVTAKAYFPLVVPGAHAVTLGHHNISGGGNDAQIEATYGAAERAILRDAEG